MKFKVFVFFLILPFLKNISSREVDEDNFSVISTSKPAIENDKINERLSRVEFYLEIRSPLKVLQESITEMQKTKRQYIDEVEAVLEKKLQNYRGEIQGLKEHLTETKNEIEQNVQNQLTEMKQEIRDEMRSIKEDLQNQLTETKREINAENEKLSSKIGDTQNEIIEKVSKMLNEAVLENDRNNKKYFEEIKNEIIDNHNSEKSRIVEELETVRNQLKQTQANITTEIKDCKNLPQDCSEVQKKGNERSGVYRIHPQFAPDDFLVWCDMTTKGGGWTYVVNRFDGSQNFFLNWTDYKEGFGKLSGEHWLGLQHLHELTYNKANELLVELIDFDLKKVYARYSHFKIGNESEGYIVENLGNYSGDAGNSLGILDLKFSTLDKKNDESTDGHVPCAKTYESGWWFRACWTSLLTGRYRNIKSGDHYIKKSGIASAKSTSSLKEARMMIRPLNGSPTDRTSSTLGHGRIVGGNEVSDIRQYPHQVALLTPDENNNLGLVCGGSILSATYVLTAAHCLVAVNVTHVRAGTIYYNDTTTEGQQTVTVSLTVVHPRYASNYDYDVGIVELMDDPLTLNEFVVPVRLPLLGTTTWGIGTTVTVTGWGRTSQTVYDSVSPVLKEVHIPIVSALECQLTFAGLFTERFVCVYGHTGNFCNGDSGGPIIAYGSGNFLVGVVSMSSIDGCAMSNPQSIADVGHIDIRSFIYSVTKL